MKKLGRVLSLSLGLGVTVALVGHFNSRTTRAVDRDHVKAANSVSDPAPVTGSAKATQSAPGRVVRVSAPTVDVAKTARENATFLSSIGSVVKRDTSGPDPLGHQDSQNAALSIFQGSCTAGGAGVASCNLPKVPFTKTLVIENVSAAMSISGNGPPLFTSLTTKAGGVQARHFFTPILTGMAGVSLSFYSVNTLVRIYADPGSSVTAFVESTTEGSPQVTWTISGHFVCSGLQQTC
jgi:hypothetical protein